ncbi:hypothetical protein AB0H00_30330 [Nocardia sp. NPDC023852]|uniref:hypothetical protein n=1 Tax=Nocardia sp. NPDC023852 TaxID=3154697 RepID=UPI0033DC1F95
MALEITPEHLPLISAQLGISTDDLIRVIGTSAANAVPMPPGNDDVSKLYPGVLAPYGQGVFGSTVNGVAYRVGAEATLPQVGAAYSGEDILSGGNVLSTSSRFVK